MTKLELSIIYVIFAIFIGGFTFGLVVLTD